MTKRELIGVSGATGQVGGRVARLLAELGQRQRLLVRDASRAPDLPNADVAAASYQDGVAMTQALRGVTTFFLVPGEERDRVAHLKSAVDAAIAAGVDRIVYLSFMGAAPQATFLLARHHAQVERAIRESGLRYTFNRSSMYMDDLPAWFGDEGVLRAPAGKGTVSWVTRDDVAAAAAHVLTHPGHEGAVYNITGPEALTLAQTAAQLGQVLGRRLRYEAETLEQARASRAESGVEDWLMEGAISSYSAMATGELATISFAVEHFTGQPAESLTAYFTRQRAGVSRG